MAREATCSHKGPRAASVPPRIGQVVRREMRPRLIWPWPDRAEDCCCVALPISGITQAIGAGGDTPIALPPRLTKASPGRKAEFLAGRCCAGAALKCLSGRTAYPGLDSDRSPAWPAGFTGSISHSNDMALALVGRARTYRGLGVDLEKIQSREQADEISTLIMNAQERRLIGSSDVAFLTSLVFSAKESLFKALYPSVKQVCSFMSSELVGWNENGLARFRLTRDLPPHWAEGHVFSVRFGILGDHVVTRVSLAARPTREEFQHEEPATDAAGVSAETSLTRMRGDTSRSCDGEQSATAVVIP